MATNDLLLNVLREQERQNVPTRRRSKCPPKKTPRLPFRSLRADPSIDRSKVITEEEYMVVEKLEAAYKAAIAENKECIQVFMRPSYVGTRCFLTIELGWLNKNIPHNVRDITLRMGDRTWKTRLQRRKSNLSGGLGTGWDRFVQEHALEKLDGCLFTLGENVGRCIFLDVQVFRLADQIVPQMNLRN